MRSPNAYASRATLLLSQFSSIFSSIKLTEMPGKISLVVRYLITPCLPSATYGSPRPTREGGASRAYILTVHHLFSHTLLSPISTDPYTLISDKSV